MCAKCKVYACSAGEKKALPKNCPMRNEPLLKEALSEYEKPENHDFYVTSSEIESLGYGQWVRGTDKSRIGIADERKVHPGEFEPMCNPVFQASLLNEQKTEFNIALGLCVGHDSFLYRYSDAFVTTLVVKDRVLAHNPAGALYCAEGYYKEKLNG